VNRATLCQVDEDSWKIGVRSTIWTLTGVEDAGSSRPLLCCGAQ
jgi:hypothetical protein